MLESGQRTVSEVFYYLHFFLESVGVLLDWWRQSLMIIKALEPTLMLPLRWTLWAILWGAAGASIPLSNHCWMRPHCARVRQWPQSLLLSKSGLQTVSNKKKVMLTEGTMGEVFSDMWGLRNSFPHLVPLAQCSSVPWSWVGYLAFPFPLGGYWCKQCIRVECHLHISQVQSILALTVLEF